MTKQEIHFQAFGYEPGTIKPVHLANGFFLALTGRSYRLELLNKAAVTSHKQGLKGEYEPAALKDRLTSEEYPRISAQVDIDGLNNLRTQLNALVSNDDAVYAVFDGYSTFGNDYTFSSGTLITDQKRKDGFAGWLLHQILARSTEGNEVLEMARRWINEEDDAFHLFTKPLQEEAIAARDWVSSYELKFGILSDERLDKISTAMRTQTLALHQACRTVDERESVHARLRTLIVGLGLWLVLYMVRESAAASHLHMDTLLFADFTGDPSSRCRAAARTCFSKHRDLIFRAYEAWHSMGRITDLQPFTGKNGDRDLSFLEKHFSDLSVRIGLAQPRAFQARVKHYEPQADTLRLMVSSVLKDEELLPLSDLARRLRDIWQITVGACDDDAEMLRKNGLFGLDEDDDLRHNRNSLIVQLKRLGLAYEPSDGLVLCGINVQSEVGI